MQNKRIKAEVFQKAAKLILKRDGFSCFAISRAENSGKLNYFTKTHEAIYQEVFDLETKSFAGEDSQNVRLLALLLSAEMTTLGDFYV